MAAPEPAAPAAPAVSDEELVEQLRQGNREAFELVYERYFRRVYHFVDRRLGNRADVEETVQEVFINIFSSVGTYRGEAPFAAWVFGLTRRTIAGRFKKKRHATVPLRDEDQESAEVAMSELRAEPTPLESYECQERLARMQTLAATRLSAEQRALFRMHHLEDLSIHDIARSLRKSEDAVKSNLYRARKILLAR
jgi:RNA polymerase sigma factor (sigma-70 family)